MALKETRTNMGYQQITSLSSAAGLTLPSQNQKGVDVGAPTMALLQAETQNVRWRDDGTDPTSSTGMRLLVGQTLSYDGDLSKLRVIEETASAKLNISYFS